MFVSKYAKGIWAALFGVAEVVNATLVDGVVDYSETQQLVSTAALAVLTVVAVVCSKNKKEATD